MRPDVGRLTRMDWQEFDGVEDIDEGMATAQAVNHAMARTFILYLQDEGKLTEVFRRFRMRTPEESLDPPPVHSVRLLEGVLGKGAPAIDDDFAAWFRTRH